MSEPTGVFGKIWDTLIGLVGMAILALFAAWTIFTFVDHPNKRIWFGVVSGLAILYYCGNYIERAWRAPWPDPVEGPDADLIGNRLLAKFFGRK